MEIKRISIEVYMDRKEEIIKFIYQSMNFGCAVEWYTMEEARAKCKQLKKYIEEGSAISFISVENGETNGFIWAYPYPDRGDTDRVYISIIYVDEKSRGTSLGKHLIEAVQNESMKRGYKKLWLHTKGTNHGSIGFYERIGFNRERIQYVKRCSD